MNENWLHIADWFFMIFHSMIIIFNLFGWIWKPTRKANLVLLLLTGGSWFILGIFYGIGYCPVTDWHWDVLRKLNVQNLPNSYVAYLSDRILSIKMSNSAADIIVTVSYFIALICSLIVNFRKSTKK